MSTSRKRAYGALFAVATALVVVAVCAGTLEADTEATPGAEDVFASVASVARNLRLVDVPDTIEVRADNMVFDYDSGRLDYRGHVRVDHAGASIETDQLTITFTPGPRRALQKIIARGNVRVERGEETAFGELAVYDPHQATIELSTNARLGSGPNLLTGDRVVVYLNEGRATVHGGANEEGTGEGAAGEGEDGQKDSRVRVVIMPDTLPETLETEDLIETPEAEDLPETPETEDLVETPETEDLAETPEAEDLPE